MSATIVTVYRAHRNGETCHFGEASPARAWAGKSGRVEEIEIQGRPVLTVVKTHDPFTECGADCKVCGMLCKRASAIDEHYASRLAFMLECMLVDSNGHWNEAAELLDEYKAEWEKVNPSPPTFMGEPMPPERRERLKKALADRAENAQKSRPYHADGEPLANAMANRSETCGSPCAGVNPADVRADVRATPDVAVATRDVAP